MYYQLITDNATLQQVCQRARTRREVALDTEFIRIRTYYPQPGLIQLGDGETVALIDPLTITDWQPLCALLQDPQVMKYLHAGGEDLELFAHYFQAVPAPFIDTQILAAFAGYSLSCGFAQLVSAISDVTLDKSEARTDWLARPLSERQCCYAAADVWYLLPAARQLTEEVTRRGWLTAACEESQRLVERRQCQIKSENAWQDIKNAWQLQPRQLACLQRLAAWRLREARRRDLAVNFIVREAALWEVARWLPASLKELEALTLSRAEIRCHADTLLACVAEAQQVPEDMLPAPAVNVTRLPGYQKLFKAIKAVVREVSERCQLSEELLASRRQINQVIKAHYRIADVPAPVLFTGWRAALLREPLSALLAEHEATQPVS